MDKSWSWHKRLDSCILMRQMPVRTFVLFATYNNITYFFPVTKFINFVAAKPGMKDGVLSIKH